MYEWFVYAWNVQWAFVRANQMWYIYIGLMFLVAVYFMYMYGSEKQNRDNREREFLVERSEWYGFGWEDAGKYFNEKYGKKVSHTGEVLRLNDE